MHQKRRETTRDSKVKGNTVLIIGNYQITLHQNPCTRTFRYFVLADSQTNCATPMGKYAGSLRRLKLEGPYIF